MVHLGIETDPFKIINHVNNLSPMKSLYSVAVLAFILISSPSNSQTLINTSFEDYSDGPVFGQDNWNPGNDNDGAADIVTNATYAKSTLR